jgi:hypothetical protein
MLIKQLIELNPLNNMHPRGPIKRPNKARQQKVLNGNANKVKYILLSSKFYASSIQDNRLQNALEKMMFSAFWLCHVAFANEG